MADFLTAYKITNNNEGGYSNNPYDSGGETYAGISRNNWPNWEGWSHIDEIKTRWDSIKNINTAIQISPYPFPAWIQQFYKQNFWDPLQLDSVNDQQIANAVYDFGVNAGIDRSAKFIQHATNVPVDGIIGGMTLRAINTNNPQVTLGLFNHNREDFYKSLSQKPGQHQFLASWLSRIKPYIS